MSTTTRKIWTTTDELPLLLGLGGNVGRPAEALRWALGELGELFGPLEVAPLYRSAPLSPVAQPDFLNTVARATVPEGQTPEEVLAVAKELERRAGRRPGARFGPRPLDVDLLLFGAQRSVGSELVLPHPRMRERRFVLAPLAELAPELALPPDGATVRELLERLGDGQEVRRISWDEAEEM